MYASALHILLVVFFPVSAEKKCWVRWKTEWSFDGKLYQEYSNKKLSKSVNWFSSYGRKCQGCLFETQHSSVQFILALQKKFSDPRILSAFMIS